MPNWKEGDPERRAQGFVIRYELLGILVAIVVQTLAVVWWGGAFQATVTTKMDYMRGDIMTLKSDLKDSITDRYTAKDANRDLSFLNKRIDKNEDRIQQLEGTRHA